MELRDHTIAVLHRHGIISMNKASLCMVDLVEIYLTDFEDMLLSKLFRDVAEKHNLKKGDLIRRIRALALRIKRRDPVWFRGAFPEGYSAPVFLRVMAEETRASLRDWG